MIIAKCVICNHVEFDVNQYGYCKACWDRELALQQSSEVDRDDMYDDTDIYDSCDRD